MKPTNLFRWTDEMLPNIITVCGLWPIQQGVKVQWNFIIFFNQASANNLFEPADVTQKTWHNSKKGFFKSLPVFSFILRNLAQISPLL